MIISTVFACLKIVEITLLLMCLRRIRQGCDRFKIAAMLSEILDLLQKENTAQKPIFVKIAPDLEWEAIADIVSLAQTYQLAGIIATNTTIRRDQLKTLVIDQTGKAVKEEAGGISGVPLRDRSTEVIRFIAVQTQGKMPIIGVGGIFSPEDAWEKITAGASPHPGLHRLDLRRSLYDTPYSPRFAFQARTKRTKFHLRSRRFTSKK